MGLSEWDFETWLWFYRLQKKKGCELKCPDWLEEVCEALALLTRFILFPLYKKTTTSVSVGFSLPLMLVNLFHI